MLKIRKSGAPLTRFTAANAGSDPMEGYGVMSAFAYITLALSVGTTLVFVISKFAKVKVLKWVLIYELLFI